MIENTKQLNDFAERHPFRMLVIGPLLGLAFCIFLPVAGFVLLAYAGLLKLGTLLGKDWTRRILE